MGTRVVLMLAALALSAPGTAAELEVEVGGVRSADGQVKLMLFDRAEGFRAEAYGLSNNPSVSGPPAFQDAAFDVPETGAKLAIRLAY